MCNVVSVQDASTSATSAALQKQKVGPVITLTDGAFSDYRWEDGRWVLSYFTGLDNKVDWDSVSLTECCIVEP